jgi:hypothetical protein
VQLIHAKVPQGFFAEFFKNKSFACFDDHWYYRSHKK